MSNDDFDHEHYAKYGDPHGEFPSPPTREQIAEAVEGAKKLVAWMDKIDADAFSYSPELGEEPPQHCVTHAEWQELLHMTDWVGTLALIQNGADR